MPGIDIYRAPAELVLGQTNTKRVPEADQRRQRAEVLEILARLKEQPGIVLADQVGMGKTFVALGVAYAIASHSPRGPVIIMVPANLVDKWEQDLKTFCELYVEGRVPVRKEDYAGPKDKSALPYGIARHSIELMRLLDDAPRERCRLIFLAQGAMSRQQTDKWIRLALIGEALRRHGRGRGQRLIQVKQQIHRFVAELIWAIGEQRNSDWGEALWQSLLQSHPSAWRDIYNRALREGRELMQDDPVPKSVVRAIDKIDLRELANALEQMPVRAAGSDDRVSERISDVRGQLRQEEEELWKYLLATTRWRSPLLIMDEAHHLKNPGTSLARQLQSADTEGDLRTGDGAMSQSFDRMLFLTATPFQLGHHELVQVLCRFGDVRWDEEALGSIDGFKAAMDDLSCSLTESQRTAICLQRCWSRLRPEDGPQAASSKLWWAGLQGASRDSLTPSQRALLDGYELARQRRCEAEARLRPWIIRHNKPDCWTGTQISRRKRVDGAAICRDAATGGLDVPPTQLLPFFLAARSAAAARQDLLGEALCSSYEAFRNTRQKSEVARDDLDLDGNGAPEDLTQSKWYLQQFDTALNTCRGTIHPKVASTVQKAVDLWEQGEKVLIFAFYRYTCRALRVHISREIESRMLALARERLGAADTSQPALDPDKVIESIHNRYFDKPSAPGRVALDEALGRLLAARKGDLFAVGLSDAQEQQLLDIMRRFLRVPTTLVRCFPLQEHASLEPQLAVQRMLEHQDQSGVSWRAKFEMFLSYLLDCCSEAERAACIEAASRMQTGGIRVEIDDDEEERSGDRALMLANVQVATGTTRRDARSRLMRAFNTPFFPDILVCSQVMGEGVDLQRCCRHVIHHDLAWNPSTIEQRTGRIDRLGCKAEGRQPVAVYLPYIAGTADERQYKVMSDREQWFRIVMGQDAVAKLIPADAEKSLPPIPASVAQSLTFHLGLELPVGEPESTVADNDKGEG